MTFTRDADLADLGDLFTRDADLADLRDRLTGRGSRGSA